MKKENDTLVLEDKDDETMLFDMCDSYIMYLNEDDDDKAEKFYEDFKRLRDKIREEVGPFQYANIEDILNAFYDREESFSALWHKILECFKLADLIRVVY